MLFRSQVTKDKTILEVIDMYSFFRKLPDLEKIREYEFRKNVALRVMNYNKEIKIDMEKLKEWNEKVNEFIDIVRKIK